MKKTPCSLLWRQYANSLFLWHHFANFRLDNPERWLCKDIRWPSLAKSNVTLQLAKSNITSLQQMQLALKKKILCEHQIQKQRCILLDIATKPLHKAQFTKLCCGWLLHCAKLCKTWPCTALHTDQLAMYTKASLESHCTHIYLCTTHLETLQPHAHTTTQPLCLLKMQNSPSLHN